MLNCLSVLHEILIALVCTFFQQGKKKKGKKVSKKKKKINFFFFIKFLPKASLLKRVPKKKRHNYFNLNLILIGSVNLNVNIK